MVLLLADVQLATDDRLDAGVLRRIEKMDGAEDVAVVGHGHGGHLQNLGAFAKLCGIASAVEHGIIGMQMKMNEVRHESLLSDLLIVIGSTARNQVKDQVKKIMS
jgi:hypothetical protein